MTPAGGGATPERHSAIDAAAARLLEGIGLE